MTMLQILGVYMTGVCLYAFLMGLFFPRINTYDPSTFFGPAFWPISVLVMIPVLAFLGGRKCYYYAYPKPETLQAKTLFDRTTEMHFRQATDRINELSRENILLKSEVKQWRNTYGSCVS